MTVRGIYDVSGLRADADLMLWLHGDDPAVLQSTLRALRRTALLQELLPTWNAMGVHRDAEFNRSHVPGFLRGERARDWLVVYPFNRSYDWYVLDEAGARADARRARPQGRGVTARWSPTRSRRSRSATTSGSCRWSPTR